MKIELPSNNLNAPIRRAVFDLTVHASIPIEDIEKSVTAPKFTGRTDQALKAWLQTDVLSCGETLPDAILSMLWEWEIFELRNITTLSMKFVED